MCAVVKEKYIDPFTDFGFKWIFGTEENKSLLISFLNDLLELEDKIVDVTYRNLEKLGLNIVDRKAIFDIYCVDEKKNSFIVELQRSPQKYFKDRSLFYTTFPIQDMSKRGDWDYELKKVYFVWILDFSFDDLRLLENKKKISTTKDEKTYLTKVQLCDMDTKELFYDKMAYYYIEMPKFKKEEKELSNHLEKWLFYLKNLERLDDIPKTFKDDEVLENAFDVAEFLKLDKERKFAYQQDLKARLDYKNSIDYAKELAGKEGLEKGLEKGIKQGLVKGLEQGLEQGLEKGIVQGLERGREEGEKNKQLEIAKNLLDVLDNEIIALKTELTVKEIEELRVK